MLPTTSRTTGKDGQPQTVDTTATGERVRRQLSEAQRLIVEYQQDGATENAAAINEVLDEAMGQLLLRQTALISTNDPAEARELEELRNLEIEVLFIHYSFLKSKPHNELSAAEDRTAGFLFESLVRRMRALQEVFPGERTPLEVEQLANIRRLLEGTAGMDLLEVKSELLAERTARLEEQEEQIRRFLLMIYREELAELGALPSLNTIKRQRLRQLREESDKLLFQPLEDLLAQPDASLDRALINHERQFIHRALPRGPERDEQRRRLKAIDEQIFALDYQSLPSGALTSTEGNATLLEKEAELAALKKRSTEEIIRKIREIELLKASTVDSTAQATTRRRLARIRQLEGRLSGNTDTDFPIQAEISLLKALLDQQTPETPPSSAIKDEAREILNSLRRQDIPPEEAQLLSDIRAALENVQRGESQLADMADELNTLSKIS